MSMLILKLVLEINLLEAQIMEQAAWSLPIAWRQYR